MYKGKKLVAKGHHQGLTEHTNIAPWGSFISKHNLNKTAGLSKL